MIPGGPQDAGVFTDLASQLEDRYTVIRYDPRGNSRSKVEGELAEQRVEEHADDAAALLTALNLGPAHIFGTSGGGQIGLDLTARYPELVRSMLAHEPACTLMLDDPSEAIAGDQAVYDTYVSEGVDAAMQKFFGDHGLDDETEGDGPPPFEMSAEDIETFERVNANFEHFLAHGLMPLSLYQPDIEALRAGKIPVAVGLGEESAGQVIHDIGKALAAKLEVEPVQFLGDHVGFTMHPEAFAGILHKTIVSN
jgi:pimeloyl-ACP methyl ester carboxylesterase